MVEGMGASLEKSGVRTTSFIKMSRDGLLASIKKKRSFEKIHEKILIKYSISQSVCPWDRKAAGAEVSQLTQGLVLSTVVWTSAGEETHLALHFLA